MKCLNPYTVDSKKINGIHIENRTHAVPCGQCPECKKQRVKDWTFRLYHEERVAKSAYFVTLTFNTEYVPITKNGYMTLSKTYQYAKPKKGKTFKTKTTLKWKEPDLLTKFFYKLRRYDKLIYKKSIDYAGMENYPGIKYYAAGEYGEEKSRPHYHIILFNVYDPTSIGKAWKIGNVDIESEPKQGAFAYCAKYIDKPKTIPEHPKDDRRPQYSVSSQNIGKSYLTKHAIRWHNLDPINNNFVTYPGRKDKQRMPRYYYEKIFSKQTRIGLAQYWEVETLINESEQQKQAEKRNLTIFQAKDQKKRYIELKFNKSLSQRELKVTKSWQKPK